jgi:Ni,Fe-hydrogenase I cytochrome b subunit
VNHVEELDLRRRELLARSVAQRAAIRASLEPITSKLALGDRAVAPVMRHPVASTAIAAAVTVFGSRKLFTLIARGIALYTLVRKL